MIQYMKNFICDLCGYKVETEFDFNRRVEKPDEWEYINGVTFICPDCAKKRKA